MIMTLLIMIIFFPLDNCVVVKLNAKSRKLLQFVTVSKKAHSLTLELESLRFAAQAPTK
jgi:hypothetical protein